MSLSDHRRHNKPGATQPLDVRISIDPPGACGCPPSREEPAAVQQALTMGGDGSMTCDTVLKYEDGCEYEQVEACESCPCYVFSTNDCVAELLDIRNGRLHYSVTIPDRESVAPLVESLRKTGADVSVHRILAANEEEDDCPTLTEKQRETLELAIRSGYYDRPREASLDDIAGELDITTSAASQRLSSVKRRLIKRYAKELGAGQVE